MDRRIGRGTALMLAFGLVALVELLLWAGDATTGGALRRTLFGKLKPEATDTRPRRNLTSSDPTSPGSGRKADGKATKTLAASSKSSDANGSCTLTGLVLNEADQPVRNAKLTVRAPGKKEYSGQTDARGQFTITGMPPGRFDVSAFHSDYVPVVRPGILFEYAGAVARTEFVLPLGTKLSGTVKDEAGAPLEGVLVAARRKSAEALVDGSVYLDDTLYKTQRTAANGAFQVAGLSLGGNVVEFSKPGYQMEIRPLEVRAAKEQPNLDVVLKRTGTLAGLVLDEEGHPVSSATLHLVRYKPIGGDTEKLEKGKVKVLSDEEGRFKFTKLYTEGFYDILVDDPRYAPATFPVIQVGAQEVVCQLQQGGRIEGVARFIDRVSTEATVLMEARALIKGTTFTTAVKSEASGRFTFSRLPYGKYDLAVRTSGLVSEPKSGLTCERDRPSTGVLVEIYEACTVKGRVVDGRDEDPVGGALVSLEASYGPGSSKKKTFQVRTDSHGGFSVFRVPAGSHTARAAAQGFLRTVTDLSETQFSLEPGERKSDVVLVLERGGIVDGYVVDTTEQPVPEAEVQLFSPSTIYSLIDDNKLTGRTDASGYFRISGIEVGERAQLYASARKDGYAKARSAIIDLTPKAPEASTRIVLSAGGTITGKVTDQNDIPVGGAVIRFDSTEFPGDPSASSARTTTRPDGTYVLPFVTPGLGRVTASRSGFVRQDRSLVVSDSKVTEKINFRLQSGLEISGTVEALGGKPIAQATVSARPLSRSRGLDSDITDGQGRFALSDLGEGSFRLQAAFKLSTADGDQAYTFIVPQVAAGTANVVIDCDVGNVLTGHVVDEDGYGIRGFTVSLRSRDDIPQNFVFDLDRKVSSRGSFILDRVPRGIYKMSVSAPGYETYIEDNLAVGPLQRTDLPRITLRSAGGVVGELYSSSTRRPVNGVRVRLLDPSLATETARELAPSAVSDAHGIFRITTAMAGSYDMEFSHPSYQAQTVASVDVSARRITDVGRIYLEAGGAIRGTVTDGEGTPLREVRLRISGQRKMVRTDAAGNYLFQGVQPGRWTVIAQGRVGTRDVYSYQVAVVEADETEQLDFRLDTSANVKGLLVLPTTGSFKSATVQIHPFNEEGVVMQEIRYSGTVAAGEGSFSILEVPPGTYFLWSTGTAGTNSPFSAWQLITLSSGDNQVVLPLGSSGIQGTARNEADGKAAKKVSIELRPLFDSLRLPSSIYDALRRTTTTGNNGKFSLPLLQSGPYQLLYRPSGGTWFAQPPLTLGSGQVVTGYDLTIP